MFNPIYTALTVIELEKLLQAGEREEGVAQDAFLSLIRSAGHTSVTPQLRETLAFAVGYFAKCMEQGGVISKMAGIYSALCANIVNGHIKI